MIELAGHEPGDRRRVERRSAGRIVDLSLAKVRRMLLTTMLFGVVLVLFLWMVRTVIIAAVVAVIVAVYLRPLYLGILRRVPYRAVAALLSITVVLVPLAAMEPT